MDLLASPQNTEVTKFTLRFASSQAVGINAILHFDKLAKPIPFPPIPLQVLEQTSQESLTVIAVHSGPDNRGFFLLCQVSIQEQFPLSQRRNLLSQDRVINQCLAWLKLMAWLLRRASYDQKAIQMSL